MSIKDLVGKIIRQNAIDRLKGKTHICPECRGVLSKCSYCDGSGKVTAQALDMYHDPLQGLIRRTKQRRGL